MEDLNVKRALLQNSSFEKINVENIQFSSFY